MKRWAIAWAVLVGVSARTEAAPNFPMADDFETNTVLTSSTPAGNWNSIFTATNATINTSTPSAHRGTYGLQLDDSDTASGVLYLVEAVLTGLGSSNGTRSIYLDGTLLCSQTGIDFSTSSVSGNNLGSPTGSKPPTMVIYFDDYNSSSSPLPSTLKVTGSG